MTAPEPPISHIIWDWNGTLFDDANLCRDIINRMLHARGRATLDAQRYEEAFGFPVRDYYARIGFDFSEEPFELVLAEGGVLSYINRRKGLALAHDWLVSRGWMAFSDLVIIADSVPDEIKTIYDDANYHYETEHSYRELIAAADMEVHCMSLVPPSGWDNYYAHMARRLEDSRGFFADRRIKLAFHREIDVFYRLEASKYIGYLFCIARKTT